MRLADSTSNPTLPPPAIGLGANAAGSQIEERPVIVNVSTTVLTRGHGRRGRGRSPATPANEPSSFQISPSKVSSAISRQYDGCSLATWNASTLLSVDEAPPDVHEGAEGHPGAAARAGVEVPQGSSPAPGSAGPRTSAATTATTPTCEAVRSTVGALDFGESVSHPGARSSSHAGGARCTRAPRRSTPRTKNSR